MPKHPAIPGLRDMLKEKVTRREQFLVTCSPEKSSI